VHWPLHVAVASVLYAALTLFALKPVLPQLYAVLPYPRSLELLPARDNWIQLSWNDELLTAAQLTRNARRMVTAPWRLWDNGQCYPMANARALGEHMLGMGLRGTVPYALTGDPVATTNVVLITLPWMAGMAMYALVAYWTGAPGAALVAGLLFAFQVPRLTNLVHPYVEANDWTVVALLAAHLLFARGTWPTAALLASAIALQTLESFYPVLGFAVLGGSYGVYLSIRYWRRVPSLLPKIIAVLLVTGVVAALVFTPYVRMRNAWGGAVGGRNTLLYDVREYGYRGQAWVGTVTAALMAMALV